MPCGKLPCTKGSLDIHKKEQGKNQFPGMIGHKNGLLGCMGAPQVGRAGGACVGLGAPAPWPNPP